MELRRPTRGRWCCGSSFTTGPSAQSSGPAARRCRRSSSRATRASSRARTERRTCQIPQHDATSARGHSRRTPSLQERSLPRSASCRSRASLTRSTLPPTLPARPSPPTQRASAAPIATSNSAVRRHRRHRGATPATRSVARPQTATAIATAARRTPAAIATTRARRRRTTREDATATARRRAAIVRVRARRRVARRCRCARATRRSTACSCPTRSCAASSARPAGTSKTSVPDPAATSRSPRCAASPRCDGLTVAVEERGEGRQRARAAGRDRGHAGGYQGRRRAHPAPDRAALGAALIVGGSGSARRPRA